MAKPDAASKSDNAKISTAGMGMFQSLPGEYEARKKARAAACPVTGMGAEYQPWSPEFLADPYKFFERARHAEPVFYSPEADAYVVMHYDDMVEIFRDLDGDGFHEFEDGSERLAIDFGRGSATINLSPT